MILFNPLCISFSSMYVFGGFSGLLLNDVLAYTPPSCQAFFNSVQCAAAGPGLRCQWVRSRCVSWEPKPPEDVSPAPFCPPRPGTLHWSTQLDLCTYPCRLLSFFPPKYFHCHVNIFPLKCTAQLHTSVAPKRPIFS